MSLSQPSALCMVATPFHEDGAIDETAFRLHLRRMVEADCGVYLGSGGSGEGHALSLDELRRVYEIGVEECKGKVPTFANPPEARTAKAMLATCSAAAGAGVDMVQVYQMDGGHGMKPNAAEQEHYYRTILGALDHPVALSVHFYSGQLPTPALFRKLCDDYPQVRAVNVIGSPLGYYLSLRDALDPAIDLYVGIKQVADTFPIGAAGYLATEPNIVPWLCRSIVQAYVGGDIHTMGQALADVARFSDIVTRWAPANPRWLKMALKVLGLPGKNGVLRPPYLLPPQSELDAMAAAFDALGLQDIEAAAKRYCTTVAPKAGATA